MCIRDRDLQGRRTCQRARRLRHSVRTPCAHTPYVSANTLCTHALRQYEHPVHTRPTPVPRSMRSSAHALM
eukprot:386729-Rhodomonas_salina.1